MKGLFVCLVTVAMVSNCSWYIFQIRRHKIFPALSTWIIFVSGTSLGLVTYALAENRDFQSGILNTADAAACLATMIAIMIWSKSGFKLKLFEKWYLGAAGLIIIYGVVSGDAWGSNIFTQVLISVGYVPTIQNLIDEKRNTESFLAWGLSLLTSTLSLYPAFIGGNTLSAIYSVRSIVSIVCMLSIMAYYQFRSSKPVLAKIDS